jgi:hypothetical protein
LLKSILAMVRLLLESSFARAVIDHPGTRRKAALLNRPRAGTNCQAKNRDAPLKRIV